MALQVAAAVLPRFRDGAWLVELAPVRDPDGVPGAITAVFAIAARAGLSLEESLLEFLRTKQLLLILDNCEHLLDAVAATVEVLEHAGAGVEVLTTTGRAWLSTGSASFRSASRMRDRQWGRLVWVGSAAAKSLDADGDELDAGSPVDPFRQADLMAGGPALGLRAADRR